MEFKMKDIERIPGVNRNKMFHWNNTLRLFDKPKVGRGKSITYSIDDLVIIAVFDFLMRFGFEGCKAKEIVEDYMELGE